MTDEPTSSPRAAPRRPRPAAWLAALAALAVAVYLNALRNGFALDDDFIVHNNDVVHGFGQLHALFLGPYWPHTNELYRPLTLVSYAVDWTVSGGSPVWIHGVNVALHALATVLVARLVVRLGGGAVAAAAAGAVFAVHPVHVEAVSSVVGRAELLATLLVLAACFLYLAERPRAGVRGAGIAALYLLGLFAKESAVALPALLVVLDGMRSRGERTTVLALLRRNAALLAVLTASLAAYLVFRRTVLGTPIGTDPAPYMATLPTVDRLATAVRLWPEYLRLLFWPADLSADWGPNVIVPVTWASPLAWLGVATGVAVAAAAVASWRRGRWVAGAVLWFALTLFPVSHILFPVGVMMAERTFYLCSVGLAFLFPPLADAVMREKPAARRLAGAMLALLLALGAARTWTRTPVWESTKTVFDSMVDEHPELWWVQWKAGQILVGDGRIAEALPYYRRAMERVDSNHYNMAMDYAGILTMVDQSAEAERILRRSLAQAPEAVAAHALLAEIMIADGRYREAVAMCDRALRIPRFGQEAAPMLNDRRAVAFDGAGEIDSALVARRASLQNRRIRERFEPWYHEWRLLTLAGRPAEAAAALDSARARIPGQARGQLPTGTPPPPNSPLMRSWVGAPPPPQPALIGVDRITAGR